MLKNQFFTTQDNAQPDSKSQTRTKPRPTPEKFTFSDSDLQKHGEQLDFDDLKKMQTLGQFVYMLKILQANSHGQAPDNTILSLPKNRFSAR